MKTREEVARFIEQQMKSPCSDEIDRKKHGKHHYGWQELRQLMDFIYGGDPATEAERMTSDEWCKP